MLEYLKKKYPGFYFVSSTTKVLTEFDRFKEEIDREEFRYAVPDFRLNKAFDQWDTLSEHQKAKVEFLCNECCFYGCRDRKRCYEAVSQKNLGEDEMCIRDRPCTWPLIFRRIRSYGTWATRPIPVSYTHLDVYKRQTLLRAKGFVDPVVSITEDQVEDRKSVV